MKTLRLVPFLVLAACATQSAIDASRHHTRLGDPVRAWQVLDQLRAEQLAARGEVDAELERELAAVYPEMLHARAMRRIFEEREDLALGDLAMLESVAPDHPGIDSLRERAMRKRAQRVVDQGNDSLRRKDYPRALAAFVESKAIATGVPGADEGIEAVRTAIARMSARAQEQFLEAVRKLPELRFVEVQWHAGIALHNTPNRAEAKELEGRARRENAESALARGQAAERESKFGAALIDYRIAQRFDATLPDLKSRIEAMEREVRAAALVDTAQIDMRAARFELAHEKLAQAFELSVLARNDIATLVQQTRRMQAEHEYRAARDLEVLGKKAEALAAFEALAKAWPDGVEDEAARIDALRTDIGGAEAEWAAAEAAEAAGDPAQALEHYRGAERFYPGYRDAAARIERLRATLPPAGGGGESNGGDGSR